MCAPYQPSVFRQVLLFHQKSALFIQNIVKTKMRGGVPKTNDIGSITDKKKTCPIFKDKTGEPAAQQRDSSRLKKDASFS